MGEEKMLVLNIHTRSGSTYSIYKYDEMIVLRSDSKAFNGADFFIINSLFIDDRLNFNGKVYFNAQIELYEKKYRVISRNKQKKVMTSTLETIQKTTKVKEIEVINKKEYNNLVKDKTIAIDKDYLEKYDI